MTSSVWSPFDDETTKNGQKAKASSQKSVKTTFFEDPFANRLPKNGLCKIPNCLNFRDGRRSGCRLICQERKVSPMGTSGRGGKKDTNQRSLQSRTYDTNDSDAEGNATEDDDDSNAYSSSEGHTFLTSARGLDTIAEHTTVFVKPPKLKKLSSKDLDGDFEKVAEDRAFRRVARWLHQTGLVDELFVDTKSLPQYKYLCDTSVTTTKSQEGVEIGPHGVTLESDDDLIKKKINEFRVMTMREMDNIDDDIVELQEKASLAPFNDKNLKDYPPIVQSTIHAKLNIGRIFTEVKFFAKIVDNCALLEEELAQTGDDWTRVKDICDDHIAMQSFLVELTLAWLDRPDQDRRNIETVLFDKLVAVRELGQKLRSKLLSGIAIAFGEGNGEEVKVLVQAMELYESEVEEVKETDEIHLKRAKGIMVIGLKRTAIQLMLEDGEIRANQVFQVLQEEAADDAQSTTADKDGFEAVMNACETSLRAMEIVKEDLIPLFPPTWNVFPVWSACVGSVCTQYLLQQIGGQGGTNLSFMKPKQLLQLMSWIEDFRAKADLDANVTLLSHKVGYVSPTDIMRGDFIGSCNDSLIQVMTLLWDIHRLVEDQFIHATQVQTKQWLENVFKADHAKIQTAEGHLTTSLPEDAWVLVRAHLTTIRERFTAESEVFFHAACIIFTCMKAKQRAVWRSDDYLADVEMCCAASNDAIRMIELAEVELEDIKFGSKLTGEQIDQLDVVVEELTSQFLQDAVYSAKHMHIFIFAPIDDTLAGRLFEEEWEDLTHNDMIITVVRTLEDYLGDLEKWLEESMLRKTIDALVRASINFYIKHLLRKSIRRKNHFFQDTLRALQRMSGDIFLLKAFFRRFVDKFPALERMVESEFEILYAIMELLEIEVGTSHGKNPTDFFPFLQKKVGRVDVTKFLCCQLWHLVSIEGGRRMRDLFDEYRDGLSVLDRDGNNETLDPSLDLDGIIVGVMKELRDKLKVKSVAKNVKTKVVNRVGKVRKRATRVIDRIAEA